MAGRGAGGGWLRSGSAGEEADRFSSCFGGFGRLGAFAATSAWPARTALSQDDKYATVLGAAGCEVADDRLGCLRSASLSSIRFGQSQVVSSPH